MQEGRSVVDQCAQAGKIKHTQNGRMAAKSLENMLMKYSKLLIKTESKRRE